MIHKTRILIEVIICLILVPSLHAQGIGPSLARGAKGTSTMLAAQIERGAYQAEVHSIYRQGVELFQNSVFYARGKIGGSPWSGTVFAIKEGRRQRVYGVVAAHALAVLPKDFIGAAKAEQALKRHFTLKMFDKQGEIRTLTGHVVWLSSPTLWDLALVEFSPKDAALFTPFLLSEQAPALGDFVQQQGFSRDLSVYIPNREIIAIHPPLFYTTMPFPREARIGLGGSPVFVAPHLLENGSAEARLLGIHNGTVLGEVPQEDMGYFTSSDFLRRFVEDYRAGGRQAFPIELQGKEMFQLSAAEYIHAVNLLDEAGNQLARYKVKDRFSHLALESLVDSYGPCRLEFEIKSIKWANSDPEYVDFTKRPRRIMYDLRLNQVIE